MVLRRQLSIMFGHDLSAATLAPVYAGHGWRCARLLGSVKNLVTACVQVLGMAVNCHGSLPRCESALLKTHWSDCAIYSATALPDCGGLELADHALNGSISPFVALP